MEPHLFTYIQKPLHSLKTGSDEMEAEGGHLQQLVCGKSDTFLEDFAQIFEGNWEEIYDRARDIGMSVPFEMHSFIVLQVLHHAASYWSRIHSKLSTCGS